MTWTTTNILAGTISQAGWTDSYKKFTVDEFFLKCLNA
jgi:hypothetical protein